MKYSSVDFVYLGHGFYDGKQQLGSTETLAQEVVILSYYGKQQLGLTETLAQEVVILSQHSHE